MNKRHFAAALVAALVLFQSFLQPVSASRLGAIAAVKTRAKAVFHHHRHHGRRHHNTVTTALPIKAPAKAGDDTIKVPTCHDPNNCGSGHEKRPPLTLQLSFVNAGALTDLAPAKASGEVEKKFSPGTLVVGDPGHGGHDTGATRDGVEEKDITLAVSKFLREELEKLGAWVVLTRAQDVFYGLDERSSLAQRMDNRQAIKEMDNPLDLAERLAMTHPKPDAFVSVHVNSLPDKSSPIRGAATYYNNDKSKKLAEAIQASLRSSIGEDLDKGVIHANFYVIKNSGAMPAVLVEIGFITNDQERKLLVSEAYQRKLAKAIALGVLNFLTAKTAAGDAAQPAPAKTAPAAPASGSPVQAPAKAPGNPAQVHAPAHAGLVPEDTGSADKAPAPSPDNQLPMLRCTE